jgi:acetyl-CoA synthetase
MKQRMCIRARSGKIRRVQLRGIELQPDEARRPNEYWEEDFPDLKEAPK